LSAKFQLVENIEPGHAARDTVQWKQTHHGVWDRGHGYSVGLGMETAFSAAGHMME